MLLHISEKYVNVSFKSLFHNTIRRNVSLYTGNKET